MKKRKSHTIGRKQQSDTIGTHECRSAEREKQINQTNKYTWIGGRDKEFFFNLRSYFYDIN
jgi:hypothetical protein